FLKEGQKKKTRERPKKKKVKGQKEEEEVDVSLPGKKKKKDVTEEEEEEDEEKEFEENIEYKGGDDDTFVELLNPNSKLYTPFKHLTKQLGIKTKIPGIVPEKTRRKIVPAEVTLYSGVELLVQKIAPIGLEK